MDCFPWAPMWPREHGAYVQIGVPLAAALVVRPSVAGGLLAFAAAAAFVAHEPLLVMRGRRGKRALERAPEARTRFAVASALSAGAGIAGLVLAPAVLPVVGLVAVAAAVALVLSLRGAAHTLGGELVAATTLAGAATPVAVAGGMTDDAALRMWLMWALAFAGTVVAVHAVIDTHRKRATRARWLVWIAVLALSGAGIVLAAAHPAAILWLASIAITAARPSAARLRRIGVLLAVTAGVVAVAWLWQ